MLICLIFLVTESLEMLGFCLPPLIQNESPCLEHGALEGVRTHSGCSGLVCFTGVKLRMTLFLTFLV